MVDTGAGCSPHPLAAPHLSTTPEPHVEGRDVHKASGGMRGRVGLARELMLDRELVVYDEPTSRHDPFTTELVDEMIVRTRARLGLTSIVISDDMASALRIADRIHLLSEGRLAGSGT